MDRHLHIVNGDIVSNKLKLSGLDGDVLVWREMLHDGPLTPQPYPQLLAERSVYFENALGIPADLFRTICLEQEQRLDNLEAYDSVTLWFEHDLFDQTIFLYLLQGLSGTAVEAEHVEIGYISIDSFPGYTPFRGMGQLEPEELASLSGKRTVLDRQLLAEGSLLWQAYSAEDPTGLVRLLDSGCNQLPLSRSALRFHLERFPADRDGLTHVERDILARIAEGASRPDELFAEVFRSDTRYGLGDLSFWCYLNRMRGEARPLIEWKGGLALPRFDSPSVAGDLRIQLTEFGSGVLAGQADRAAANGFDRWLGGVHLTGRHPLWRWDESRSTLTPQQ